MILINRTDQWSWVRGQLTPIDRSFGSFLDTTLHHIQDTHVCPHMFTKIPFYNAQEATAALKQKLGSYYRYNDQHVVLQFWECFRHCVYVENWNGVWWFAR